MASPARFERAAFRLGGERSILLSYGDKFLFYSSIRSMNRKQPYVGKNLIYYTISAGQSQRRNFGTFPYSVPVPGIVLVFFECDLLLLYFGGMEKIFVLPDSEV